MNERLKVLHEMFDKLNEKQKKYQSAYKDTELYGFLNGVVLAKELIIEMEEKELLKG